MSYHKVVSITNEIVIFIVNKKEVIIDLEDWEKIKLKSWSLDSSGRVGHSRRKKGLPRKWFALARFIDGTPKGMGIEVDHINRNVYDNRKQNLRRCNRSQNQRNVGPTKGRFKGVHFDKSHNKIKAAIRINGFHKHLGYFTCEVEAAKVYNIAAKKAWGEFAYINPIPEGYEN